MPGANYTGWLTRILMRMLLGQVVVPRWAGLLPSCQPCAGARLSVGCAVHGAIQAGRHRDWAQGLGMEIGHRNWAQGVPGAGREAPRHRMCCSCEALVKAALSRAPSGLGRGL